MRTNKGEEVNILKNITKVVGLCFFSGWCLLGTFFYLKAVIEWILC